MIEFTHFSPKSFLTPLFLFFCFVSFWGFFFFCLGFLSQTIKNHGTQGKGEGISLTPHYHFLLLHRHLVISRAFAAESSPLHIASNQTGIFVSECKSLTTKLRALHVHSLKLTRFVTFPNGTKRGGYAKVN